MLKIILPLFAIFCVPGICQDSEYGCDFNFVSYEPGYRLTFPCFDFVCYKYSYGYGWMLFHIFDCFRYACRVCNGINIKTFDNYYYRWPGTCNYTLSQPIDCTEDCNTYNPKFGIFSDFEIYLNSYSRLGCTTYKVDPNTVVTICQSFGGFISPLVNIKVNGNPISLSSSPTIIYDPNTGLRYPIIAWKISWWWGWGWWWWWNCVFIIGPDYTILACPNCIYIWTHWWNLYDISGLCGYYTNHVKDDFLTRECVTEPLSDVADFAITWMTLQQKDDGCCPRRELDAYYMPWSKCDAVDSYSSTCSEAVASVSKEYQSSYNLTNKGNIIESCVDNCCGYSEYCDTEWTENAKEIAALEYNITDYLQDRDVEPPIEEVPPDQL